MHWCAPAAPALRHRARHGRHRHQCAVSRVSAFFSFSIWLGQSAAASAGSRTLRLRFPGRAPPGLEFDVDRRPTSSAWRSNHGSRVFRPRRAAARRAGRPSAGFRRGAGRADGCAGRRDPECRGGADGGRIRHDGHLLAQGVHSPHPAMPRRLPLLHLRQGAAAPQEHLPRRRRSIGDSARGQGRRLQGSPVHPGRQTRGSIHGCPRGLGCPGRRQYAGLPRAHGQTRAG